MSKSTPRDPQSGKRILRFLATSALVVAPASLLACAGTSNGNEVEEPNTNVGAEEEPPLASNPGPEEEAIATEETTEVEEIPEGSNVDHTEEPHPNVAPEEDPGEAAEAPE